MTDILRPSYAARITAVRNALSEHGIDCLLVSSRENVRYLVGFAGSAGWVLVSNHDALLATDARYIEQARRDLGESHAHLADSGLISFVSSYVSTHNVRILGFEGAHLSFTDARTLESAITAAGNGCELRSIDGIVENLRVLKDPDEIAAIRRAAELADGAIAHARATIRTGMTERELAWNLERWMRENGSGSMPFSIIVACGQNSALPHATPTDHPITEGKPIVIDLGATWGGYCSDLTRTLFLGRMASPFDKVYYTVLAAHKAALTCARSGMAAADVDDLARSVIRDAGLADAFTHGLGHGVGLEVHEKPAVSSRSTDVLLDRTVFTIEPGVYLPGQGGVRIEDTVVLRDGKAQSFSHSDKEDPIVTMHIGPHRA